MSEDDWRAARLAEMWSDYVHNPPVSPEEDRAKAAVDVLRIIKEVGAQASKRGDEDSALRAAQRARAVLALLITELGDWVLDFPGVPPMSNRDEWHGFERAALIAQLTVASTAVSPLHREALDPAGVVLPRWLLTALLEAMNALNQGEVHALVRPAVHGRHDDSWSWDQMRGRAVEYVHYLRGQGMKTGEARERVAKASRVATFTLRQWEAAGLGRKDLAFDAGKLAVTLIDTPSFAAGDGQSIDAHTLALHEEIGALPLRDFGASYADRFGHRHNQ